MQILHPNASFYLPDNPQGYPGFPGDKVTPGDHGLPGDNALRCHLPAPLRGETGDAERLERRSHAERGHERERRGAWEREEGAGLG